jgi:hypothetical protein
MFYLFRQAFPVGYNARMVVPFPVKPASDVRLTDDQLAQVSLIEHCLDGLLAGLYAQLPADPASYPIRIGDHVIHYRHRPRSVVTAAPVRRAG